jgi:hypothetical protein
MNVQEIADTLMELFKQNKCRVGDVIIPQWILQFRMKLNPDEGILVESAIHHLESIKFVRIVERQNLECLELTQEGYNSIYEHS